MNRSPIMHMVMGLLMLAIAGHQGYNAYQGYSLPGSGMYPRPIISLIFCVLAAALSIRNFNLFFKRRNPA
jgi:hypothetical protein